MRLYSALKKLPHQQLKLTLTRLGAFHSELRIHKLAFSKEDSKSRASKIDYYLWEKKNQMSMSIRMEMNASTATLRKIILFKKLKQSKEQFMAVVLEKQLLF